MGKWADFVITGVRYNVAHTQIDEVRVADDWDRGLGPARIESRRQVIANIKGKKSYITGPPSPNGIGKGEMVRVITVGGIEYLRTNANNTPGDNMGNLPPF